MTDRERFEAWYLSEGVGGQIGSLVGQWQWSAWQASRKQALEEAVLECDAQATWGGGGLDSPERENAFQQGAGQCAVEIGKLSKPEVEAPNAQ